MNGQVQFHAKGLGMEKLLNAARKQGIAFSRVKREKSRSLLLRCSQKDYAAFSALAREKGIPCQPKRGVAGSNDAASYQRSRGGMRTCVLSVPCRYIHGPSSAAMLSDVEAQYLLARAYAEQPVG